jgi:hypothetical protein
LMLSGLMAGVLLAGGSSSALVPAILAIVCAGLLRRIAPALPWRFKRPATAAPQRPFPAGAEIQGGGTPGPEPIRRAGHKKIAGHSGKAKCRRNHQCVKRRV